MSILLLHCSLCKAFETYLSIRTLRTQGKIAKQYHIKFQPNFQWMFFNFEDFKNFDANDIFLFFTYVPDVWSGLLIGVTRKALSEMRAVVAKQEKPEWSTVIQEVQKKLDKFDFLYQWYRWLRHWSVVQPPASWEAVSRDAPWGLEGKVTSGQLFTNKNIRMRHQKNAKYCVKQKTKIDAGIEVSMYKYRKLFNNAEIIEFFARILSILKDMKVFRGFWKGNLQKLVFTHGVFQQQQQVVMKVPIFVWVVASCSRTSTYSGITSQDHYLAK